MTQREADWMPGAGRLLTAKRGSTCQRFGCSQNCNSQENSHNFQGRVVASNQRLFELCLELNRPTSKIESKFLVEQHSQQKS